MRQLRHVVGVADMHVAADADLVLITYALGSCLGLVIHDPVARVGGMLHAMLPDSSIDARQAQANPFMFVDLGVPLLFRAAYAAGARKDRLVVKVAGGAAMGVTGEDRFQIGKRNIVRLRELFWKNGVLLTAEDVGGSHSRTLSLALDTGETRVRTNGIDTVL